MIIKIIFSFSNTDDYHNAFFSLSINDYNDYTFFSGANGHINCIYLQVQNGYHNYIIFFPVLIGIITVTLSNVNNVHNNCTFFKHQNNYILVMYKYEILNLIGKRIILDILYRPFLLPGEND